MKDFNTNNTITSSDFSKNLKYIDDKATGVAQSIEKENPDYIILNNYYELDELKSAGLIEYSGDIAYIHADKMHYHRCFLNVLTGSETYININNKNYPLPSGYLLISNANTPEHALDINYYTQIPMLVNYIYEPALNNSAKQLFNKVPVNLNGNDIERIVYKDLPYFKNMYTYTEKLSVLTDNYKNKVFSIPAYKVSGNHVITPNIYTITENITNHTRGISMWTGSYILQPTVYEYDDSDSSCEKIVEKVVLDLDFKITIEEVTIKTETKIAKYVIPNYTISIHNDIPANSKYRLVLN